MPTPIIIGVADVKNRSTAVADALEPAELMLRAIKGAISDATSSSSASASKLQATIDSIDVVRTWTWPYPDLPGLLAEKLGVKPSHKYYSDHGGNSPGKLFDEAARRVSAGKQKVAVVVGGEALASLSACAAAKKLPPSGWTPPAETVDSVFSPTGRDLGTNLGAIHQIGAPIHIYPLYENGFRAHRNQGIKENHDESTKLYAQFEEVAAKNEYAWGYGKKVGEKGIGEISGKNRMICSPYPLLMNAFNTVNLAAACILTTTDYAKELGIPEEKWTYPLGGAGTKDSDEFWLRPDFHSSPSISHSLDAALSISSLAPSDIDIYDFYSCFPIVPKLACTHLGLDILNPGKPITLLGGLTSFGGAGNNYSLHALTEMTRRLRKREGEHGLVLANGGVLSYQHVVILGRQPRADRKYPAQNPLEGFQAPEKAPEIEPLAEGEAVVETYTVEFKRDGSPLRAYVVGRLKSNGKRFLANHGDEQTLRFLASGTVEGIGKVGVVRRDEKRKERGLFSLEKSASL